MFSFNKLLIVKYAKNQTDFKLHTCLQGLISANVTLEVHQSLVVMKAE
jgi:hypothetical protein